jgi:opacity protein-like surface antigen
MKKLLTIFAIVFSSISVLQAQESMFNLGDKVVSLGIGFGSTLYTGSYYSRGVPPISIAYEQAIKDEVLEKGVIGVGGWLGYTSYKYDYLGWGYKYSNFIIGAMGSFHYPLVDKLDTYVGIGLGYNIASAKEFGTIPGGYDYNVSSGGVVFAGMVGARYYFTDKIAVFAQAGYGISYFTIGVCFRL